MTTLEALTTVRDELMALSVQAADKAGDQSSPISLRLEQMTRSTTYAAAADVVERQRREIERGAANGK